MGEAQISSEFEYSASFLKILIPGIIIITLSSFLLVLNYSQYISFFKELINKSVWDILPIGTIFIIASIIVGLIIGVLNIPFTMVLEGYYLEKYQKYHIISYLRNLLRTDQWKEFDGYRKDWSSEAGKDSIKGALAYGSIHDYFSHCLYKLSKKYLFSWNDVPGNDNKRLIEFLTQKYGIDWVKNAKIKKSDGVEAIRISTEKNNLSLSLNNEKTELNLKIDDGRTDKFIVKMKNGKLKIYDPSINDDELKKCIMSTKLGNVFKSMEIYPTWKYGMDGVFFWTRIQLLMSEEDSKTIDKMRAFVDMFVELTWIFFFAAIIYWIVLAYNGKYIFSIVSLVILMLFSLGSYKMAVQSALKFGLYVRSIFDLYREELWNKIKKGVFDKLDSLPEKERWDNVFRYLYFYNTTQCEKCGTFYDLTKEHVCDP